MEQEKPTFSLFLQLLKPFYGNRLSNVEFVKSIFQNCTLFEEDEDDTVLFDMLDSNINKFFSGNRDIPKKLATETIKHFDKERFQRYIEDCTDDLVPEICKAFNQYIPSINQDNYSDKLLDFFLEILRRTSVQRKRKSQPVNKISALSIEEQFEIIIQKICDYIPETTINLNFDPKSIDDKLLDTPMLKSKVKAFATDYYPILNELVLCKSSMGKLDSKLISDAMKDKYLKIKQTERNKIVIFDKLVEWVKALSSMDQIPCEIVVSFFVQKCEVFDAITR